MAFIAEDLLLDSRGVTSLVDLFGCYLIFSSSHFTVDCPRLLRISWFIIKFLSLALLCLSGLLSLSANLLPLVDNVTLGHLSNLINYFRLILGFEPFSVQFEML